MEILNVLIKEIKTKKELSFVDNNIIKDFILKYYPENSKIFKSLLKYKKESELKRSNNFKLIVKNIRTLLRRIYGMYITKEIIKRNKYLEELKKSNNIEIYKKILSLHISTKERLGFYNSLYKEIFNITGKPNSILDISSGLNPFSIVFMNLNNVKYMATELNKEDCDFLNEFFKIAKINGKTIQLNLFEIVKKDLFKNLDNFDVCFLFKVFDSIELSKKHKLSELIIKNVPAKFIVVSFSTKVLSTKKMNFPKRGWIELMLKRLNYYFNIIEKENEIFYVIRKS